MMDQFDNPGDSLRNSMTAEKYATLMEQTDSQLPCIGDQYAQWDYQGAPTTAESPEAVSDWDGVSTEASVSEGVESTAEDAIGADSEGAEADVSNGADCADAGGSDGASADDD